MAPNWKLLRSPSMLEWINTLGYDHTMECDNENEETIGSNVDEYDKC